MVKLSFGCAGWDYKDWVGTFFPKPLERKNYLDFYSKFFNILEVNSTFYNLPKKAIVNNWYNQVPSNFKFIVKVWQRITHNLNDPDLDYLISQFFSQLTPLRHKVVSFLLQFPPWFKFSEKHFNQLRQIFREIPREHKYIIELRDNSWFEEEIVSEIIDGERLILATTYMPGIKAFYFDNQECYYVRLIGDRQLTTFNQIQRRQEESIAHLLRNLKLLEKKPKIFEIFIIVNNHFQGNAPESINSLKQRLNLPFKEFNQQKRLSDYF